MSTLPPASTLKEAYANLDPLRPLSGDWLKAFYVDRPPESRVETLLDELRLDPREDDKSLFSGQQGCGETTELHRLIEALKSDHVPVYVSVEEELNLADVHYTDLLVILGLKVFKEAEKKDIPVDSQKLQNLHFWYEKKILERVEKQQCQTDTSVNVNLALFTIGSRLAKESPFRQHVRAQTEANLSDLLERLNDLLTDFRKQFGRRILIVVDGLDKIYDLDQAAGLFLNGANALISPACRVIYTLPYPLFYRDDFQQVRQQFHRNFLLPNVKTRQSDGTPYEAGRKMLKELILKRMEEKLITPEALDILVDASGGLLRELLRLARGAVTSACHRNNARITCEDVQCAFQEIQNSFRRILKVEDYQHLWRVYETKRLDEVPSLAGNRLLRNMSVLEYNGETWWDLHPAVRALLEKTPAGSGGGITRG
ncbi:conserved hypothetical protein [Candidatus Methylacidithermus pantelleriae]|uniref:Uncharacterized protein n=1 Tax=Candidatus Methylacidithermus pantelleriae TaxID=2744239 RepID=A0A8J2BH30_9BACT|nr:conserved hypothetical protein [Candidatus Methylacidithermus pantelleriae]